MRKNERIRSMLALLDEHYPTEDKCYLYYENEWQLLFATIMSAQCTDERVNTVTRELYKKYPTLESFASADLSELEQDIRSTGFYHNKAKNIIAAAGQLLTEYNGVMPSDIDKLTALAGVGRKTANVVRTHIFHIPSIVVDTHVKRITNKLGIVDSDDPVKIEFELMRLLPKENWGRLNTQLIAHGRSICKARRPDCENCFLNVCCKSYKG